MSDDSLMKSRAAGCGGRRPVIPYYDWNSNAGKSLSSPESRGAPAAAVVEVAWSVPLVLSAPW